MASVPRNSTTERAPNPPQVSKFLSTGNCCHDSRRHGCQSRRIRDATMAPGRSAKMLSYFQDLPSQRPISYEKDATIVLNSAKNVSKMVVYYTLK